jgi:hypothetical protein
VQVVDHAAKSTWFSPARPMEETRTSGSWWVFLRMASVSQTLLPHRWEASFSSALSFSMLR